MLPLLFGRPALIVSPRWYSSTYSSMPYPRVLIWYTCTYHIWYVHVCSTYHGTCLARCVCTCTRVRTRVRTYTCTAKGAVYAYTRYTCMYVVRTYCTYGHVYVPWYVYVHVYVLPSGTTGTMVSAALASELVRPRVGLAYVEERSDPSSGPILKASLAWRSRTSCSARCWAFLCAKWLHRHSRLHWVPHPNAIQAQA